MPVAGPIRHQNKDKDDSLKVFVDYDLLQVHGDVRLKMFLIHAFIFDKKRMSILPVERKYVTNNTR